MRCLPHRITTQKAELEHAPVCIRQGGEQGVDPQGRLLIFPGCRCPANVLAQVGQVLGVVLPPVVGQGGLGDLVQPAAQLRDRDVGPHSLDRFHEHL